MPTDANLGQEQGIEARSEFQGARDSRGAQREIMFDDLPDVDDGEFVSTSLSVRLQTDEYGVTLTRRQLQKGRMGRRFLGPRYLTSKRRNQPIRYFNTSRRTDVFAF